MLLQPFSWDEKVEPCSAVILAGGRATRLGGVNKALIEVGGKPVIHRVLDAVRPITDEILVIGGLVAGVDLPGARIVPDEFEGGSALVGLYSGMAQVKNDASIAVACDMPFLSTQLLAHILRVSRGVDAAVPRIGPHLEALHAVYRRSCLPIMLDMLESGNHKIIDFYPRISLRQVAEAEVRKLDPDLTSMMNINTPGDLDRARALAAAR